MECPPSRRTVRGVWSGGSGGFGFWFLLFVGFPWAASSLLPAACRVLAGSFMAESALLQVNGGRTNMECPPSRSGGFGPGGFVRGVWWCRSGAGAGAGAFPGQLPLSCLLPAAFWPAASVLAGSFMAKSARTQLEGGRTKFECPPFPALWVVIRT